jgi:GT2 family glycosyltransferase
MELSIIIVNWNTEEITKEAISSVIKYTSQIRYEIIVVDNGSEDGSVSMLKKLEKKYPFIKLILNKKNVGFGKGNNQGFNGAKGEYVLMLNTDTVIHDNVLDEMVSWMDTHPKAGAATCALKNKDGSMQGTGGYFPTLFRVFSWMFFLEDIPFLDSIIRPFHPVHGQSPFYKGTGTFEKERQQDWITGAFVIIRKKILDDVGYFDEDYFMYSEEVDLFWRIKQKGWLVWYLPKWSITHLGGASSTSEFPIISEYKGIKMFYKKHMPSWQLPILRFFLKSGAVLRVLLFGIIKGRDVARTYVKAFAAA